MNIEKRAQLAAHLAQVFNLGATFFVEVQPQHPAGAAAFEPEFDIDDLQSLCFRQRRGEFPNAGDGLIHKLGPLLTKSSGSAHFECCLLKCKKIYIIAYLFNLRLKTRYAVARL